MGRKAGRAPDETRRAILDAAGEVIRARGLNASLEVIASAAGVTRAGLLYHFSSKQTLFLALVADEFAQLRVMIDSQLDPSDDRPGRLTRAYIRALLRSPFDESAERGSDLLLAQLLTIPAALEFAGDEADRLERELHDDGLPGELVEFVVATADGAYSTRIWGGRPHPDRLARIEDRLLSMTVDPEVWDRGISDERMKSDAPATGAIERGGGG